MPRRSAPILLALGIVLAIITGGLIYYLLQQAAPAAAGPTTLPPTPVPTKPLPVAANLLTAGTTLTTTDFVQRAYPEDLLPVGVITDTNLLVGKRLLEDVQPGEFVRPAQIGEGDNQPLSTQVDAGKVIMAFSREDLLNKSKVLREGDHIDLLLSIDVEEETATETRKGRVTTYTLQNIEVKKIVSDPPTQDTPNPEPTTILFQMEPQDAVIAKWVKDVGGTLDFTLRGRNDTTVFETVPISQDYLFDTYGVRAPLSSTKPKQQ